MGEVEGVVLSKPKENTALLSTRLTLHSMHKEIDLQMFLRLFKSKHVRKHVYRHDALPFIRMKPSPPPNDSEVR